MQIQITKYVIPTRLPNIVLWVAVWAAMWALPYIMGVADGGEESVPVLFMQRYTLWSMSAFAAAMTSMAALLCIGVALWLASQRRGLIPSQTMMPFVTIVLSVSAVGHIHCFDHRYIALILLLIAIDQMMTMYDFGRQTKAAFNTALLLCTAALFEPMYVWLLILFVINMVIYRSISWRTAVSMLTGVALMAYVVLSVAWLTGQLDAVGDYAALLVDFRIQDFGAWRISDITVTAALGMVWLTTMLNYLVKRGSYSLNMRLNFIFLSWCCGISCILILFCGGQTAHLTAIPLLLISVNAGIYFTNNRNTGANVVFILTTLTLIGYRVAWLLGY